MGTFIQASLTSKQETVINESTKGSDEIETLPVDGHGTPPRIFIPDVLTNWPWSYKNHPDYEAIEKESAAWMTSFKEFHPIAQDTFDRLKLSLLACLAYPNLSKQHARVGCDLMNFLFIIDEYSESDKSTPSEVQKQVDIVMDALRNPHVPRPIGEWIGGEMARQFWETSMQDATEISKNRFVRYMDECLEKVVQQSIDRGKHRVLDITSFIEDRRLTVGVKPCFCVTELEFDIPDHVMEHPTIQEMVLAACEIISLSNDTVSYNVEQMRGDDLHNIITSVMKEHNTDVNGAMLWTQHHIQEVEERFIAAMGSLPQWEEPLNSQVRKYCSGLGEWVRGNYDWCFETEKYFGNKGAEVKKNRWMSLMPKGIGGGKGIGPVRVDGSLL